MASKRVSNRRATAFDCIAQEYHGSAPVSPIRYAENIVRELDLRPGDWVVELGCGSGGLAIALARLGMRITGVDCCRTFLEIARNADGGDGAEWIQAYAEEYIPNAMGKDGPDLVLSYEAFHLFSDKAAVIASAASYLKPAGSIAVGWCEYHWESAIRDLIVSVFAEFGIEWGQWGYQECSEFVEIIEATAESFASIRTRSIRVAECTSLARVAQFLASIGKVANLHTSSRQELRRRLEAEFVRAVGAFKLMGHSTYWLRWATRRVTGR